MKGVILRLQMCITTRLERPMKPSMYRNTDNARYSLETPEWNGKWQPYQADDVQLQFYMMSPYVFKTLFHNGIVFHKVSNSGCVWRFSSSRLRKSIGLHITELGETVRPFRHDEYERFILSAFPLFWSFILYGMRSWTIILRV